MLEETLGGGFHLFPPADIGLIDISHEKYTVPATSLRVLSHHTDLMRCNKLFHSLSALLKCVPETKRTVSEAKTATMTSFKKISMG